jgi:hypothetical protein
MQVPRPTFFQYHARCLLHVAFRPLPAAFCLLLPLSAFCFLLSASCLLPPASCRLPPAACLPPPGLR